MSCSASNMMTRSKPEPVNVWAVATSKLTRSLTPASAACLRAASIDSAW